MSNRRAFTTTFWNWRPAVELSFICQNLQLSALFTGVNAWLYPSPPLRHEGRNCEQALRGEKDNTVSNLETEAQAQQRVRGIADWESIFLSEMISPLLKDLTIQLTFSLLLRLRRPALSSCMHMDRKMRASLQIALGSRKQVLTSSLVPGGHFISHHHRIFWETS